jgi:hypothetical protein
VVLEDFALPAIPDVRLRRQSFDPAKLAETISVSLEKDVVKGCI